MMKTPLAFLLFFLGVLFAFRAFAGAGAGDGLRICSALNFKDVQWPASVPANFINPFALGLNISGSFEGPDGWSNLTNNFDGQGISMGLLNQNLGQGSLEPLWIDMRQGGMPDMKVIFTAQNLDSLLKMLSQWQAGIAPNALNLRDYGYSELDDPQIVARDLQIPLVGVQGLFMQLTARNQRAVNWAKSEVLSGRNIKTDWARELKNMAVAAEYRSIQLQAAEHIHAQARALLNTFQFASWRAYLFFFDIVVQNGGIPSSVQKQYWSWLKSNSHASETTRLVELLNLRLQLVRSQYRADVRSRKLAIINGSGVVHGAHRDFQRQYCYESSTAI